MSLTGASNFLFLSYSSIYRDQSYYGPTRVSDIADKTLYVID